MSLPFQSHSNDNNDRRQQQASPSQKGPSEIASNFVLGPVRIDPNGDVDNQQGRQFANGSATYVPPTDAEHKLFLLEHLSNDLGNLLNQTDISDCFLNVKGTFMAVHKCILAARSTAFAAVISGNFNRLDSNTKDQIETMDHKGKLVLAVNKTDPDIMKQVVLFMYTGKCELDDSNAYSLLDASGRYDIKDLKIHVGRFLAVRIDINNILLLLKAAYKYNNKLIRVCCIEYFINNAKEVMGISELWKQFAEENKEIVAELLYWLVNKDQFYNEKPQWERSSRW